MKKIFLTTCLFLIINSVFSQAFKTVRIDSLVSITLPAVYAEKDTLGQKTFTARLSYGFIVVTRIPNSNNAPLKKEKDLKKVFKNYVKDVKQVGKGTILKERDTTVGTLKGHLFTLQTQDDAGNLQYRKFLFIYTHDASYTFQYFYNDAQSEMVDGEVKSYFSAIKLDKALQRNNQYLVPAGKGMPGSLQALLYGGAGFIVLIMIIFAAIRVKKRKKAA